MELVKGSIWAIRLLLLLSVAQEVAAHHLVGEGLQGVGGEVVFLHPVLEIADQAVHVAFHGEVLVGDVKLVRAHEPQFVQVGDMQGDIGFAPACQFAQDGGPLLGLCQQGIGKALEVAPFLITCLGAPELVFVFADGLCRGCARGWERSGVGPHGC